MKVAEEESSKILARAEITESTQRLSVKKQKEVVLYWNQPSFLPFWPPLYISFQDWQSSQSHIYGEEPIMTEILCWSQCNLIYFKSHVSTYFRYVTKNAHQNDSWKSAQVALGCCNVF